MFTKMKNLFKHKKGVMDQLSDLAIGVVSVAIVLVVVFLIMAQVGANSQVVASGNATAAVNTLTGALATIPAWIPIVIVTIIGALLIGLVAIFRRR